MNAPTLIVGLGGKGSEVVKRVSKMVNEEQRQRIGFVVFDTDVNELREIRTANPHIHTIQTSIKMTVGEYLDIDNHAKDNWFPVNSILNNKMLTEGAGQVRAISRLAFDTAIRNGGLEELHKAIGELYELEGEDFSQALRVIIVSSLAGGTGSGLIVPVGLYIRNYLATHYRQGANITRGFFLLPEIFYHVIPSEAERNNLKCNAYATLREIDAFLMKGDSTIPSRYKNTFKIEFPDAVSGEYEEYNVSPYDFCFLFDGQNVDGKNLSSFDEYLDHAANCIYAQSIGPMNKRSNSSEDNTIRRLVAEKGRNRYCGAGTSLLTYPTEDVKRYMGLNWAKECVSDSWLVFDREYKEKKKRFGRVTGKNGVDIDRGADYILSVTTKADNKDTFARAIQDACLLYSKDGEEQGYKWDQYVSALQEKIDRDLKNSSGNLALNTSRDAISKNLKNIQGCDNPNDAWSLFTDAYNSMQTYERQAKKQAEKSAINIAYSLFHPDTDDIAELDEEFYLEKYLRDSGNNFIHPCAIRLFLYSVKEAIKTQYESVISELRDDDEYFKNFEKNTFDIGDTPEVETVHSLNKTIGLTWIERHQNHISGPQSEILSKFSVYFKRIDSRASRYILSKVYEEGLNYVQSLIKAFELFFDSLESKISNISTEIRGIENKYVRTKGHASRYVCASEKCLQHMREVMPYMGSAINLDVDLCKAIYNRVSAYNKLKVKGEPQDYFKNLFDKDIIGFFEKQLMESHAQDIDMDIITAIQKEAEFEAKKVNEEDIEKYVVDVINSAKILASPFIEKPMGDQKEPIYACAYNNKLNPKDHSPKSILIDRELANFGGKEDSDIPLNQILFYKSFYGLRANELSKFAPPFEGETYKRNAGEYFKAYYELVGKLTPDTENSEGVTPHIDKNWHIITNMPDLDENNQERQLNRIFAAFFWGFTDGFIDLFEQDSRKTYRIKKRLKNIEKGASLEVSNKTQCDRLYEVLDALSIYPELVDGIMDAVQNEIEKELNDGKNHINNDLIEACKNVRIRQISSQNEATDPISIFEIPFVLRKSMKADQRREEDELRMVDVIISETQNVIRKFCRESELGNALYEFYTQQLDMMLDNIKKNNSKSEYVNDFLFMSMCSSISDIFEDAGMRKEAKDINTKVEKFRQG